MKTTQTRLLTFIALLFLVIASGCIPNTGGSQDGSGQVNDSGTVNVVTKDFSFSLDGVPVKAGKVTFVVTNEGNVPHDFKIEGNGVSDKTEMIEPGNSQSLTVDLSPGTYSFICTAPMHELMGMKGDLSVVGE